MGFYFVSGIIVVSRSVTIALVWGGVMIWSPWLVNSGIRVGSIFVLGCVHYTFRGIVYIVI